MFADIAAPNRSSQYRLIRTISIVLLGLLQGLNRNQLMYCV